MKCPHCDHDLEFASASVPIKSNKRISIRIAYPWDKEERGLKGDARYQFLKNLATTAGGKQLKDLVEGNQADGPRRLRGTHGQSIREIIFQQLDGADIVLADFSGENLNVMLEIGFVMRRQWEDKDGNPRLFLFCEKEPLESLNGKNYPGDLHGVFIGYYTNDSKDKKVTEYKLEDSRGFSSAFQNVLQELTEERKPCLLD